MPVGTPVSLGVTANTNNADSYTHTTTGAVPSGGRLVVAYYFITTGATPQSWSLSCDLGGISIHIQDGGDDGGTAQHRFGIGSIYAASGLASSSTITATPSPTAPDTNGCVLGAAYFEGSASGSGAYTGDDIGTWTTAPGTAVWSSGSFAVSQADNMIFGCASHDHNGVITSTPDSPAVELWDTRTANNWGATLVYQAAASAGSYTVQGDFVSTPTFASGVVAVALTSGSNPAGGGGIFRPGRDRARPPFRGKAFF